MKTIQAKKRHRSASEDADTPDQSEKDPFGVKLRSWNGNVIGAGR